MSTTAVAPTMDDTSLAAAIANQLASTQWEVAYRNQRAINGYKLDCANAAQSYVAHAGDTSITLPPWPTVPGKWAVGPPTDLGFQFAVLTKDPVCDPIAPPDTSNYDHGTGNVAQTAYLVNHHPLAVGETPDNPPVGTTITAPDGSQWRKVLMGITPWGKAVEWQRIS